MNYLEDNPFFFVKNILNIDEIIIIPIAILSAHPSVLIPLIIANE